MDKPLQPLPPALFNRFCEWARDQLTGKSEFHSSEAEVAEKCGLETGFISNLETSWRKELPLDFNFEERHGSFKFWWSPQSAMIFRVETCVSEILERGHIENALKKKFPDCTVRFVHSPDVKVPTVDECWLGPLHANTQMNDRDIETGHVTYTGAKITRERAQDAVLAWWTEELRFRLNRHLTQIKICSFSPKNGLCLKIGTKKQEN